MAESITTQAKEGIMEIKSPVKFIVGGLLFLLIVLIIEAYKPGAITGPIKSLISSIGIG